MPEYILYLTRPQFPNETASKVRIYSSDPDRYCVVAGIKIQGVNYIVRMWDTVKPHPRIKKVVGRWVVKYTRLWDSERNYQNPDYREEVIAAIKFCQVYNDLEVLVATADLPQLPPLRNFL